MEDQTMLHINESGAYTEIMKDLYKDLYAKAEESRSTYSYVVVSRDERLPNGRWVKYMVKGDNVVDVVTKAATYELMSRFDDALLKEQGWFKQGDKWLEWTVNILAE